MKTDIRGGHAFSYVDVLLAPGESITTESDAMSSMDAKIDLKATFNGGFLNALMKKFLGGETLFISQFTNNTDKPRQIVLVQPTPGEVRCKSLNGEKFNIQPGGFLACSGDVTLGLRWAGFVSFIAREGLFKLQVEGTGDVWYGAYGALIEREVDGELIIDTGHLVAYDPDIKLNLQLAGGLFSSIFGGEGLVTRVQGKGKVVLQTRSIGGLVSWLNPKLPL